MTATISPTLQQALSNYTLPWAIYTLDGVLLGSNAAVDALFGMPMAPLVGSYNVLTDETARTHGYVDALLQVRDGGSVALPVRHHLRPDGGEVWYEGHIFGNRDASGQIISLSTVFLDVTSQKQSEQNLLRRSEEALQAQQATFRELSTPLIPLSEGIVVMPLVGSIDSQRAQLIMETLLEGISNYQADVAILDITGVPVVDTQVADALLRAARAARLLGAVVVLTGIGSHIAQTLITVGADLSGLVTLNNLQSGIAYAIKQLTTSAAGLGQTV